MTERQRLYELLTLVQQRQISDSQLADIETMIAGLNDGGVDAEEVRAALDAYYFPRAEAIGIDTNEEKWQHMLRAILEIEKPVASVAEFTPISGRRRSIQIAWMKYAAAIILVAGTVFYFYTHTQQAKKTHTVQATPSTPHDIAPGGQRAILTLGDGRVVILDSAADGQLAEQAGSLVRKKDGQIIYHGSGTASKHVVYNTMSTPTGGQYQLRLPDGTKVWLNAASSITYPVVFNSDKREVRISGEAYLEVAKDAKRPFLVNAGDAKVEVLGTRFNVNAYANEPEMQTTLVDGRIAVVKGSNRKVMAPGQQAVVANDKLTIRQVNTEDAVAWTKGFFSFHGADLPTVMRQLERWYGIQVRYKGTIPQRRFSGELPMNSTLSQMTAGLSSMRVQFVLEGNTLIIQ